MRSTVKDLTFGIDSFVDVMTDATGKPLSDAETIRRTVDLGVIAEESGLDSFSLGEHYHSSMLDSAPAVVLSAIAARTERITLGTSVTVLSTQDPVRVFHQFSTLNALSGGRAHLTVGRASSTDSFPLFGYDLRDYDALFDEKLELWLQLLEGGPVTWDGSTRPALDGVTLHPTLEAPLPTWVGVGGSPQSVVRAASHGLPLMLAIIGGNPARFAGHAELFRRALHEFGKPELPVGQHSIGLVAETDDAARDAFWPVWRAVTERMAIERGWHAATEESFVHEVEHGALMVGSPETVARRIAESVAVLGLSRFDLKSDLPGLSFENRERTIRLLGAEVAPRVRELVAALEPAHA
jgi:probable LLM family oxidoreductase